MDPVVRGFLKASLVWLSLGVTVGVAMAVHPAWTIYRPVHEHMNLLGFVSMMIFGVAYHVIPRFSGQPLWRRQIAVWHAWVANAGLALMAIGFVARVQTSIPPAVGGALLGTGGCLSAVGAYLFAYNIWRTINASVAVLDLRRPAGRPRAKSA
jgi:cbb3-type cytochrome oxidase subunit 1